MAAPLAGEDFLFGKWLLLLLALAAGILTPKSESGALNATKLTQIARVALILVENAMGTAVPERLNPKEHDLERLHRAVQVLSPLFQNLTTLARKTSLASLSLAPLAPPVCTSGPISGHGGYSSLVSPSLLLGMHSAL